MSYLLLFPLLCSLLLVPVAHSKEISVGAGSFGPYYTPELNSGIFPDIITAVFREMPGFEPKFVFDIKVEDVWRSYQTGRLDAISNLFDSLEATGCRSDPVFRFSDVVISKRKDNRQLERLADLKGLSIVAFAGAKGFLGEDYARYAQVGDYLEVGKQELQPRLMLSDRYDVNVGDLYIFLHGLKKVTSVAVAPNEFKVHELFPQISSRMGFRDESLCPLFNAGLAKIKASGEYEGIYQRYLDDLGFHR